MKELKVRKLFVNDSGSIQTCTIEMSNYNGLGGMGQEEANLSNLPVEFQEVLKAWLGGGEWLRSS